MGPWALAWAAIPKIAKISVAILASLGVLVAGASQLTTYADLPERVDAIEVQAVIGEVERRELGEQMQRVEEDVTAVKCILVQKDKGEPITECL